MADKVVVGNINSERGHAVIKWLRQLRVTVFIICELGGLKDDLNGAGRVFVSPKDTPPDCAIWVRSGKMARLGRATYHQVTKFIKRPGADSPRLWRDRHIVRFRFFNRVWYSVHANAAIAGPEGRYSGNKGADAWRLAMVQLRLMIRTDQKKGRRVRVGGDFNCRPNRTVKLNPAEMFEDLGMKYLNVDVMYLAWDPRTDKKVSSRIGNTVPGGDAHGTIHATFKPAKRPISRLVKHP